MSPCTQTSPQTYYGVLYRVLALAAGTTVCEHLWNEPPPLLVCLTTFGFRKTRAGKVQDLIEPKHVNFIPVIDKAKHANAVQAHLP